MIRGCFGFQGRQRKGQSAFAPAGDSIRIVHGLGGEQPPHDFAGGQPRMTYTKDARSHEIVCDFIAGCDGSHGVSRGSVPGDAIAVYERALPYAWLGVLSDTPPVDPELIYSASERGFALCSMRSASRSNDQACAAR